MGRGEGETMMMTKESVEKLLVETGHAINANAVHGLCPVVEDCLCKVTTLCVELLNYFDEEEYKAAAKAG